MPGKKQQITIRTTSCEMSYRWVLPLRQQANLYCHILIIWIEKARLSSKSYFIDLIVQGLLFLYKFSGKGHTSPLSPKSVKVSLALHSLREPCPRVTAGLVRLILRIMQKR